MLVWLQSNIAEIGLTAGFLDGFPGVLHKLDESVGKVVQALQDAGILQDSIVVFTTDNGGPAAGFNINAASNWPLRGVSYHKNYTTVLPVLKPLCWYLNSLLLTMVWSFKSALWTWRYKIYFNCLFLLSTNYMLIVLVGMFEDGDQLRDLAIDVLIVLKWLSKGQDVQGGNWIHLAQNMDRCQALVNVAINMLDLNFSQQWL